MIESLKFKFLRSIRTFRIVSLEVFVVGIIIYFFKFQDNGKKLHMHKLLNTFGYMFIMMLKFFALWNYYLFRRSRVVNNIVVVESQFPQQWTWLIYYFIIARSLRALGDSLYEFNWRRMFCWVDFWSLHVREFKITCMCDQCGNTYFFSTIISVKLSKEVLESKALEVSPVFPVVVHFSMLYWNGNAGFLSDHVAQHQFAPEVEKHERWPWRLPSLD